MGVIAEVDDGYDIDEIITLEWERRPGAKVRCRSMSVGEMLEWSRLNADRAAMTREDMLTMAARLVADVVVEWNFRHWVADASGVGKIRVPVPVNVEGAKALGWRLLLDIFGGYMDESVEVRPESPLDGSSHSGDSYPEELMTTVPL